MKLFLSTAFLFISFFLKAQQVPLSIKVINQKREPVKFATVTITNRTDSTQIFTKSADSSGKATFNLQKNEQYTIKISAVNYLPFEKGVSISGNQTYIYLYPEPLR